MPNRQTFLSGVKEFTEKANVAFDAAKAIVGAGFMAIIISWLLHLVSQLHWVLGAVLAVLLSLTAVWLTGQVKRASSKAETIGVLGVLALGLMTLALVCAWISFTLHESGIGDYSVPAKYSPGTFFDLYMYTFLDLLPGIKVLKTLNLKLPIESRNFVAGLPILGFKLFVVWLFFDAFSSWRKAKQNSVSVSKVRGASHEKSD